MTRWSAVNLKIITNGYGQLFSWTWDFLLKDDKQKKRQKSFCFFQAGFLLYALIVNKPKKHLNFCFSLTCGGSSLTRRVKAGLGLSWRFFLRVPLKVSFVAPDVLYSYLFSLWTGRSSRHNDGEAQPQRHCCRALQKMAVCLMWFRAGVGTGDFIAFEREVTKLKCKS